MVNPGLEARAWAVLESVPDPEIPVVSLRELGILREVHAHPDGLEVVITPTYSGCPAMSQMADDVHAALAAEGLSARITTRLAPAWTTDWITDEAREKLRAYGIAPPARTRESPHGCTPPAGTGGHALHFLRGAAESADVPCPRCGSAQTTQISRFGSTACKALYRCLSCQEPFDHFKPY